MALEDVAEVFFKTAGRFLWRFFLELIFEFLCYGIGWATLKVLSLGRFPSGDREDSAETICSVLGLIVLVAGGGLGGHYLDWF